MNSLSKSNMLREKLLSMDAPKQKILDSKLIDKYVKKKKYPASQYDCTRYQGDCFSYKSAAEIEECLRQRRREIEEKAI